MGSITNFPITVFGKKEKFSDTMTRGRCRVFHKGHNRNGTYITDDFAKKLIASAPYTPVKGIYDCADGDYLDHGRKRSEGRIYGIVPAEPNFAWEPHTDSDGKVREYACFDVLYYTALYEEAGEIMGKGESMELYRQTLEGSWKTIEGKKAYVFTNGCFLGLQVLGDEVEPCFHGASFYSQEDSILAILEKYEKKIDLFQTPEQGGNIMNINFKLSDSQKHDILFNLLNPNFNEKDGWTIDYMICDIYDEYALVFNYAESIYERAYYIKDDVEDKIEITKKERSYIIDVNAEEKRALEDLKGEKTYLQVVEMITEQTETVNLLNDKVLSAEEIIQNLTDENNNYSTKVGELENSISTLTTERDDAQANLEAVSASYAESTASLEEMKNSLEEVTSTLETERANYAALNESNTSLMEQYSALTETCEELRSENNALTTFKKDIIDNQKKAVISNYSELLEADVIESYMSQLDSYTAEELDMRLTYECKKANPSIFSKQPIVTDPQPAYVPKDEQSGRGINDILAHYEKK